MIDLIRENGNGDPPPVAEVGGSTIVQADAFDFMASLGEGTVHAIVTDPPYGVKEYEVEQLHKRQAGEGGIWRLPPAFDHSVRAPLPRFTALDEREREVLREFFEEWSREALRILKPGGHVMVAGNTFLSQLVFSAIVEGGLEFRGEIIRLVRTLRGGDRPKNAEAEFEDACSLPRGSYEPWGLFRKPIPKGMTVAACLREYKTGALRRRPDGLPFSDVIPSERTPRKEREIANHPSIKPQSLMQQLVYAALPLGEGVVLDPFMGSGSTIAAVEAVGYTGMGVERSPDYFEMARVGIPRLAEIRTGFLNRGPQRLPLPGLS